MVGNMGFVLKVGDKTQKWF